MHAAINDWQTRVADQKAVEERKLQLRREQDKIADAARLAQELAEAPEREARQAAYAKTEAEAHVRFQETVKKAMAETVTDSFTVIVPAAALYENEAWLKAEGLAFERTSDSKCDFQQRWWIQMPKPVQKRTCTVM